MAIVRFNNVADMKRQPIAGGGVKGFPVPMMKQMAQPIKPLRRKVSFPKPTRPKMK